MRWGNLPFWRFCPLRARAGAFGDAEFCLELAAAQIVELDLKIAALAESQLPLLNNRVEAAQAFAETDLPSAHRIPRGLIKPYTYKPRAESIVEQARQAMGTHPLEDAPPTTPVEQPAPATDEVHDR